MGTTSIMSDPLLPGPTTFTLERTRNQLRDDMFRRDSPSSGVPPQFQCEDLGHSFEGGVHRTHTAREEEERRKMICHELYERVLDSNSHCSGLDDRFSQIVSCNFQMEDTDDIPHHAYNLLTRLPARSLQLPDVPPALNSEHCTHRSPRVGTPTESARLWDDLQVSSYVSANVIRTAILCVSDYGHGAACLLLQDLVDTIASLIGTAGALSSSAESELARQKWFIVRAFLWTSWQRCTMMHFHKMLSYNLVTGFNDHNGQLLILRGPQVTPDLSIQEMSRHYATINKPQYMCGWAFELLRNSPICIGLDFRRFFLRYSVEFGDRLGRCLSDNRACKGDESGKCQRFKGMRIENQSLHDGICRGDCGRLTWDEASYRSFSGARAVALQTADSRTKLIYRQASTNTLAISHVWSHGQGGRPEAGHGFNDCLHRRYVSIAVSLGCDSYWMDTPCIPEDHKLRREAIENINYVFEQSKATLVCDKDLMDIDASDLSIEFCELILVTMIVCDWNIRAWTFLEAFRARESIHILCRDGVVILLRDIIERVHRQGSIDIALLLLGVPHLLPAQVKKDFKKISFSPYVNGFLMTGVAGSHLSHREASRPGDDIVIWSLLLGDTVYNNAKDFWKSRRSINTSYLISTAPRLKEWGLGWAPSSPIAQLVQMRSNGQQTRLLSFDGLDSEVGLVVKDGFLARWYMYDFIGPCIGARRLSSFFDVEMQPDDKSCPANLREIRHRFLKGYLWGALLRPVSQTKSNPVQYRGDTAKTLVVVCASNKRIGCIWEKDDRIHWRWRGVYEWDMAEPLPKFVLTDEVLLV